ncbi:MAG: hypothetical protein WC770_09330 [Phycisphaerae bacterium]|jgi:hypothetical protein
MPSISSDYRTHDIETQRLLALSNTLSGLSPIHQKLVAEIVLLRLFSLFENLIRSVTLKLLCRAVYIDGSIPMLLTSARSSQNAFTLLKTYGRNKNHQPLWSKATDIKENLRYVINHADNIIIVVDRNSVMIDELRRVRNRIAHNNAGSRKDYRHVVRKHYGAFMNHVTPGKLLLTQRIQPPLLEQYIRQERILVKDIVKA